MLSPLVAVAVRAALIQWSIEYGQEKAPDDSGAFDWVTDADWREDTSLRQSPRGLSCAIRCYQSWPSGPNVRRESLLSTCPDLHDCGKRAAAAIAGQRAVAVIAVGSGTRRAPGIVFSAKARSPERSHREMKSWYTAAACPMS